MPNAIGTTPAAAAPEKPSLKDRALDELRHYVIITLYLWLLFAVFSLYKRLILQENGISDTSKIEGTGVRGQITKGDVLTFLGKASGPLGTYKAALEKEEEAAKKEKSGWKAAPPPPTPLDGPALRRLIVNNLVEVSQRPYKPGMSLPYYPGHTPVLTVYFTSQ